MRTAIFHRFADLSHEFCEDFDILWALPTADRSALVSYVSEMFRADTMGQAKIVMERAVTEIGGDPASLLRALKLLRFISAEWNPIGDTPEDFLKDLAELGLVPSDKVEDAEEFLLDFLAEIQGDNTRRLEKGYAASSLPNYLVASTLIDFRAVFERPFGTGGDDKLEEYQPRCVSFVPVVIVRITRDSGDPRSFQFQCEDTDIRRLIDQLEAALRDLEAARLSLPMEGGQ